MPIFVRRSLRLPPSWRWSAALCVAFSVLIGSTLVAARASVPDPATCLRFTDGISDNGLIDLHTGATIGVLARQRPARVEAAQLRLFGTLYQTAESPDGTHIAYSVYDARLTRLRLFVKATDRAGFQIGVEVQAPLGDTRFFPYYKSSDFSWSPDSQWLAYWWQTEDGQAYVGVADVSGHTRFTQHIAVSGNDPTIFYHGWSADSGFMAVSSLNALDGQFTLSIWSAPALQPARMLHYSRTTSEGLSRLTAPDQLAIWSAHGHQIAYLTTGEALQLAIAVPSDDPVSAALPAIGNTNGLANYELPYMSWAPDERSIAVVRPTDTSHRLDLIDTTSLAVQFISDRVVAMQLLPNTRYVRWSADGDSLFYAQATADASLSDLSVYNVPDQHDATLIGGVFNNARTTPDDSYLLFKQQRADALDAVLLNPDTGTTLHVPGLPMDNATNPLFVLGQSSDNGWLALADLRLVADSASQIPRPQISVWAANVLTGAAYPLPNAQGNHYGNGESRFVSPDGHWLAAILTDGNSTPTGLMLTVLADGSMHTIRLNFPPRSLFLDLVWASDSIHLAVRTNRSEPTALGLADTATVIDVQTGQSRQFGPLMQYPSMAFATCQK